MSGNKSHSRPVARNFPHKSCRFCGAPKKFHLLGRRSPPAEVFAEGENARTPQMRRKRLAGAQIDIPLSPAGAKGQNKKTDDSLKTGYNTTNRPSTGKEKIAYGK